MTETTQTTGNPAANATRIKWSYMDHWSMLTARGWVSPQAGPRYADRFYKCLAGVGFQGVDLFDFRCYALVQHFGSIKNAEQFAQDRGIERFVNVFGNSGMEQTHLPETHDETVRRFEAKIAMFEEIRSGGFTRWVRRVAWWTFRRS